MAKRIRKIDQDVIKKRIQEGRGQGIGSDYKPWLTIQEVASLGLVTREKGWKTNRLHQMLSKLELAYFYVLEWASPVSDIREQYPLLPLEETVRIAQEAGIRHPIDPRTRHPAVMTTDFLVTVRQGIQAKYCARTIKYARDLQSKRTIEKFEIERRYWQARNIDWGIVTELDIPTNLTRNVEVLHDYRSLADRLTLSDGEIREVAEVLTRQMMNTESSLRRVTADCDRRLGLELGSSLAIAYHLLANQQWQIDMDKPLSVSEKLTLVAVTGLNPVPSASEAVD
jgi:hypothetical protein